MRAKQQQFIYILTNGHKNVNAKKIYMSTKWLKNKVNCLQTHKKLNYAKFNLTKNNYAEQALNTCTNKQTNKRKQQQRTSDEEKKQRKK